MNELRASYGERDAYLDQLARSYADGRLDDAEFGLRRDAILSAVTHADILEQFRGLPAPVVPSASSDEAPSPTKDVVEAPKELVLPPPETSGLLNRRNLLIAGGAVVGVGLVGAALVAQRPVDSDPVPTEAAYPVLPVNLDEVRAALAGLRQEGATNLLALYADEAMVYGQAQSPGDSAVVLGFEMPFGEPLTIREEGMEPEAMSMSIDAFEEALDRALQTAHDTFDGELHQVALEWYEDGVPVVRVTFADGVDVTGELGMDVDGRLLFLHGE